MSFAISTSIPFPKTISVVLLTAVHIPIKVPSDLYKDCSNNKDSVAAVVSTVNVTVESVADTVLSFDTTPVVESVL